MTTIGFVGLGTMGAAISGRLLDCGHTVHGYNRTPARAADLLTRGLIAHTSPREVAQAADVVISMVTDTAALNAVTRGMDGILAGLRPGQVYLDMSTVDPAASRAVADRVHALGARMLDAPVSGSVPAAEQGTLSIMVAGDRSAFEQTEPLLHTIGNTVTYVGDNGRALLLKLAVNISLAAQLTAFSEGLLLAEDGGIDRSLALSVLTTSAIASLTTSAIASPMLKTRAPLLLEPPDSAWFSIDLLHKDLQLALAAGQQHQLPLPTAAAAQQLLEIAQATGHGHDDIAGVITALSPATP